MHAYFDDNDALFAHRRVYTLQEYLAKVPADKIPALRAMVEGGKPPADVEAWLKAQDAPFRAPADHAAGRTHPAEFAQAARRRCRTATGWSRRPATRCTSPTSPPARRRR